MMKSIVLLMALSLTAGVYAEVEIQTCTEDADCDAGESCICIDDGILDFNSATSTRSSMSTGAIVGGTVAMMLNDQTSVSSIAFGAVCGAAMAGVSGADAAQTCGCIADGIDQLTPRHSSRLAVRRPRGRLEHRRESRPLHLLAPANFPLDVIRGAPS